MKEFILNMFNDPNFPIYLGTVIVFLLIAFFVIFFMGKKDQKEIEKTQRLMTINNEENNSVNNLNMQTPINNNLVQPVASHPAPVAPTPIINEQSELQMVEQNINPVNPEVVQSGEVKPAAPIINENKPDNSISNNSELVQSNLTQVEPASVNTFAETSSVQKVETNSNLKPNYDELLNSIDKELKDLEAKQQIANANLNDVQSAMPKSVFENVNQNEKTLEPVIQEAPKMEEAKPIVDASTNPAPVMETKVVNNVYSSVYTPAKESNDQINDIELPKLKEEENKPVLEDKKDDILFF